MKDEIAVYIHIPFCKRICPYCDFAKVYYQKALEEDYLKALKKDINQNYQGEICKSIYIGGGTPSILSPKALKYLFSILDSFKKDENLEYTIECNLEDINEEKLAIFKKYGINRISVGIQTSILRLQKKLNREVSKAKIREKINLLKQKGFKNINVDLMYALPEETLKEFEEDLAFFISLEIAHISTYSLQIEPHTKFFIDKVKPLQEDKEASMYKELSKTLKKHGYQHYEVSNFALKGFESKHNLTYWSSEEYYGFGAGASFYYHGKRGCHSRNIKAYINNQALININEISQEEQMDEFLFLGLRKSRGISKLEFSKKFTYSIKDIYAFDKYLNEGLIKEDKDYLFIPEKYFYVMNSILVGLLNSKNIP